MSARFALWSPLERSQLSESTGTSWPTGGFFTAVASHSWNRESRPLSECTLERAQGDATFPRAPASHARPPANFPRRCTLIEISPMVSCIPQFPSRDIKPRDNELTCFLWRFLILCTQQPLFQKSFVKLSTIFGSTSFYE